MGLFSSFFSALFARPGEQYSDVERYLSEHDLRHLVNEVTVPTLSEAQAGIVRTAILNRRRGDGKISERQIAEELRSLVNKREISIYDCKGVMKAVKKHFKKFQ